jgi:hypothetical protein
MSLPIDPSGRAIDIGPSRNVALLTQHDTNPLASIPRGIMVGAAGTVTFRCVDSAADVAIPLETGTIYLFAVKWLRDTGTTPDVFGVY